MIGKIKEVIIHGIGNKTFSGGMRLSKNEVVLTEKVNKSLNASLSSAKFSDACFQFFHESGELRLNPMYVYVDRIFSNTDNFIETSCKIAIQLYESSEHPKIHAGELMVVLFENCEYKDKKCSALGLFKTETRDTFFDFKYNDGSYSIIEQEGLNFGGLEKGTIIYDLEKENGYCINVIMRANKQIDAKYWLNDFLHITQASDSFYKTRQIISLTRNYVKDVLSKDESVSRVGQTEILSRAASYLTTNENFDKDAFCDEVFRDEKYKDDFHRYEREIVGESANLLGPFELDRSLIKKKSRELKSVIKLDKNFHIYVHGGDGLIKRGYDPDSGMAFYQLFFKEEE